MATPTSLHVQSLETIALLVNTEFFLPLEAMHNSAPSPAELL